MNDTTPLQYLCDECETPVFEIRGDAIVVRCKHHGTRHTTVVPIKALVAEYAKDEEVSRRKARWIPT